MCLYSVLPVADLAMDALKTRISRYLLPFPKLPSPVFSPFALTFPSIFVLLHMSLLDIFFGYDFQFYSVLSQVFYFTNLEWLHLAIGHMLYKSEVILSYFGLALI